MSVNDTDIRIPHISHAELCCLPGCPRSLEGHQIPIIDTTAALLLCLMLPKP
jgi:hypothetical protein